MYMYYNKTIISMTHSLKDFMMRTKLVLLLAFPFLFYCSYGQTTYSYTGAVQTYTFPAAACFKIEGWGAGGGSGGPDRAGNGGNGGGGAYSLVNVTANAGDV